MRARLDAPGRHFLKRVFRDLPEAPTSSVDFGPYAFPDQASCLFRFRSGKRCV